MDARAIEAAIFVHGEFRGFMACNLGDDLIEAEFEKDLKRQNARKREIIAELRRRQHDRQEQRGQEASTDPPCSQHYCAEDVKVEAHDPADGTDRLFHST